MLFDDSLALDKDIMKGLFERDDNSRVGMGFESMRALVETVEKNLEERPEAKLSLVKRYLVERMRACSSSENDDYIMTLILRGALAPWINKAVVNRELARNILGLDGLSWIGVHVGGKPHPRKATHTLPYEGATKAPAPVESGPGPLPYDPQATQKPWFKPEAMLMAQGDKDFEWNFKDLEDPGPHRELAYKLIEELSKDVRLGHIKKVNIKFEKA